MKASCSALIPSEVVLPDGKLLLAFSGGDDSLALLSVLSKVAKDRSEALYVNHALRLDEELIKEEERNRKNAEALGIPLHIVRLEKGEVKALSKKKRIGIEAAARELRYGALKSYMTSGGFSRILTAHHKDDQAETLIMRMLSSSPFYAWRGIIKDDETLYRPFLGYFKKDILSYLETTGLTPSVDSTNDDTAYRRNFIRHNLMPFLSEDAKETMASIAENVSEIRSQRSIKPIFQGFYISYSRHDFLSSPRFLIDDAVFEASSYLRNGDRLSRAIIESVIEKTEVGKGRLNTSGLIFLFSDKEVRIYPECPDYLSLIGDCPIWDRLRLEVGGIGDALTLSFPIADLVSPVIIRTAREGDFIELKCGWKKISELMKDQRVPYSLVIEDKKGIVAYFARPFGGRDRLTKRFLGIHGDNVALALIN